MQQMQKAARLIHGVIKSIKESVDQIFSKTDKDNASATPGIS